MKIFILFKTEYQKSKKLKELDVGKAKKFDFVKSSHVL